METSILGRAQVNGIAKCNVHNLRDYTLSKHKKIDDTPYGGGAGMVLQIEPIDRALKKITDKKSTNRTIVLSAKGKRYTQADAKRLKNYNQIILICGRYEGIDERVTNHLADEEISIGDYVLTGGELGAMVIADSVVRLLPKALGNKESVTQESHKEEGYKEHPQYTKPEIYNGWAVPKVLLSGDHKKIAQWQEKASAYKKSACDEEKE